MRASVATLVGLAALASTVSAGNLSRSAALELEVARLGFAKSDVATLVAGDAAARALDAADDSELSAMGVVVLPAPIDEVIARFSDLSLLEESGMAVVARRFSAEPATSDLAALDLPDEDAHGLLKAKVKDSDVKLSADEISQIRGKVPPSNVELFKQALIERLVAYRAAGVDGLGTYADKKEIVRQTEISRELLERLGATRPADEQLAPADRFQYWSLVKFGDFKPLVEMNDVAIYRGERTARIETIQLYASHYCESLVTGIDLVELPGKGGPATLMRLTFRAQVDSLGGLFGGIKRSIGRSRLVDNLSAGLGRVRETVGNDSFDRATARRD
jgi:hypothetical protein